MPTIKDIHQLTTEEKIKLAEQLWNSIEKERTIPLSSAQEALLNDRLALHRQNPSSGKTWEEVKKKYYN